MNETKPTTSPTPVQPHIPADVSLPEITVKAVLLGIGLSMLLGAANAYLGLKAGMTVAASIPAAVISMGVLRLARRSNILENNIVQTAASAGESLAAGVIFTLPALVLLGAWSEFDYLKTTALAALGGIIGVLFTVPLRRALVIGSTLKYPEGVATAEVLKVGERTPDGDRPAGGPGIGTLVAGGALGALFKLGETGLRLWNGMAETAFWIGGSIGYAGINLAPALTGVGYIVGLNIAVLVFLGGAATWYVVIPILAALGDFPANASAAETAWSLWSTKARYIGVGAMLVGGLWALIRMRGNLVTGIRASLEAYRALRGAGGSAPCRTDIDMPMPRVGAALGVCAVLLFLVFSWITGRWALSAIMAVAMLAAGFLFSAVASYMAGLVGSSNNPVSGVTIATILTTSLLLLAVGMDPVAGPAAAILIGSAVCCAAAIGGDNMQDLKTGQLVGATPWKQQVMQVVGVLAGAVVMAPVLTLLLKAYGIGPIEVEGQTPLAAPQATLMASVAKGVFDMNLPWLLVGIGMGVAVVVIAIDLVLERKGSSFRTPVLAVAVGLYLPLELGTAMLLGGLIAWAAGRALRGRDESGSEPARRGGLLFAAGLITGEAVLGILLAVPIVVNEGVNPLDVGLETVQTWPGMVLMAVLAGWLYRAATRNEPGSAGRPTSSPE